VDGQQFKDLKKSYQLARLIKPNIGCIKSHRVILLSNQENKEKNNGTWATVGSKSVRKLFNEPARPRGNHTPSRMDIEASQFVLSSSGISSQHP
jgi:hypothetical protein